MSEIYKLYKKTQRTLWEVSNYGNVKKNGKLYDCRINIGGYIVFGCSVYLHKAVAELFIPNPEDKPQVDHIDTNKLNNHVNNLQWCTQKENNNNPLTLQHYSEAQKGKPKSEEHKQNMRKPKSEEHKQKISEAMTGEKNPTAKKCVYNNIEFGSIKDAWRYAKTQGYDKTYQSFRSHYK